MKLNTECLGSFISSVTLRFNDKPFVDGLEASEEDEYVWAIYRDVRGRPVPSMNAEPGAVLYCGIQVIKLTGKVELSFGDDVPDRIREEALKTFKPLVIEQKQVTQPHSIVVRVDKSLKTESRDSHAS